jgi:benzoate membrane transport protein
MRASVVISAIVAVLVGFGSTVVIIIAAAHAVGATQPQTASWISGACAGTMIATIVLSVRYRMPIIGAWSTPGAAMIAATSGITLQEAVGAFMLVAVLILVTAALRPLNRLIARIPASVASAMLAGILFGFVASVLHQLTSAPVLVAPMLLVFVVLRLYSPSWAVLTVMLGGIALVYALGLNRPLADIHPSTFELVAPQFHLPVLIGLGLPLYLVTMASQNLPGFAVLRSAGYEPPTRPILAVTAIASLLTAPLGAHTTNLAAITASICTGEDAHPDRGKRWLCGPVYAFGYAILTLFGAALVALFASFPTELVATVAGIALLGPLINALGAGLAADQDRFVAVTTFVVTASGLTAFGIGSAFWGLATGILLTGIDRLWAHRIPKS